MLAESFAFRQEKIGGVGGIEGEHLVVTGDDPAGADIVGELRGFAAVEVASDLALGAVAVDWEEGHVDREGAQFFDKTRVKPRVATVVEGPRASAHDVAEEFVMSGVVFEFIVRGGDAVESPAADFRARAIVEADRLRSADLQSLGDEGAVRLRNNEPHSRIRRTQRQQRFGIEMIGVVVRGGDD